jgi:hypothetical protein
MMSRAILRGFRDNERMLRPTLRFWTVLLVMLAVPEASQVRYQILPGRARYRSRNQVDTVMDVASLMEDRDRAGGHQPRRGPDGRRCQLASHAGSTRARLPPPG